MRWAPPRRRDSADLGREVWGVRWFPSPVPGSALRDERISRAGIGMTGTPGDAVGSTAKARQRRSGTEGLRWAGLPVARSGLRARGRAHLQGWDRHDRNPWRCGGPPPRRRGSADLGSVLEQATVPVALRADTRPAIDSAPPLEKTRSCREPPEGRYSQPRPFCSFPQRAKKKLSTVRHMPNCSRGERPSV